MTFKPAIVDSSPVFPQVDYPSPGYKYLFVALSVIVLLGSTAASVYLFPEYVNWSIGVGSAGLFLVGILAFRYLGSPCSSWPQKNLLESPTSLAGPTFLAGPTSLEDPIGHEPFSEKVDPRLPQPSTFSGLNNPPDWTFPHTPSFSHELIHPYMKYLVALYYPQAAISEEAHSFPIEELDNRIRALNQKTTNYQKFNYPFCLTLANSHSALVYINRTKRRVEYYALAKVAEDAKIQKELSRIAEMLTREESGSKAFTLKITIKNLLPAANGSDLPESEVAAHDFSHPSAVWILYCLKDRFDDQKMYGKGSLKQPESMHRMIKNYTQTIVQCTETMNALVQQAREEELEAYRKHYSDSIEPQKYLLQYEEDCNKIPHIKRLAQVLRGMRLDPASSGTLLALRPLDRLSPPPQHGFWAKNPPPAPPSDYNFDPCEWLDRGSLYLYMQFLISPHYPQITLPQISRSLDDGIKGAMRVCCPIGNLMMNIQRLNQETFDYKKKNYPFILQVTNNHWTLVYINRTKRIVDYYDSKINYGGAEHTRIVNELNRIAKILTQDEPAEPGSDPFKVQLKITTLLQPDSYQCGVWVLFFLDKILNDPHFNFNNLNEYVLPSEKIIANYRIEILHRLIQMEDIERQAEDQEKLEYKNYYAHENIGLAIYSKERQRLKCLLRWKQLAQGALLKPPAVLTEPL